MIEATESSETGAGGLPPTPGATPSKRLRFFEDEGDGPPAPAGAGGNTPTPAVEATDGQTMDDATAAAVRETRLAFFGVRDAGAANRIEQGQLLLAAQAQLAKYGTGTFTAMLVAPRPDGFGFKSATSAYELMAEAEGKPKRSHKAKLSTGVSTPGRSNEATLPLPLNLDGASLSPSDPVVGIPDDLPATLDTSHTSVYVRFSVNGVYVPKAQVAGFTAWLRTLSSSALSDQFLALYQAANPSRQEESNAASPSIQ
ncbi:MAG: hypothetical protein ACHP8B_09245 [Terriglobales bacterium]